MNADAPGRRAAVAAAALSLLLLALALPRLAGYLRALPATQTLWSLHDGHAGSEDAMRSAAADLALAARLTGNGFLDLESGYALLKCHDNAASRLATIRGLARTPGNPSGWVRLAWLRLQAGDRGGAGAALRLSLLSGAAVPELMPDRLRLGLRLLPDLDPDTRDLLRRQVRLLSTLNPAAFRGLSEAELKAFLDLTDSISG